MGRERKCILCHIVYNSKQEMDEHLRSMLHHRELENLKGRDCSHECRVCRVSVVGLTEYASHISSPLHKQRVQAQQRDGTGAEPQEEYFDEELVLLIQKRKELIRIEEEEAKRQTKGEEHLRQHHHKKEDHLAHKQSSLRPWGYPRCPQLSKGCSVPDWQGHGAEWSSLRVRPDRPCPPSYQARSATWHAEAPPDFRNWRSLDQAVGSLGSGGLWGAKKQGYEGFHPQSRHHVPLSNGDCTNPNQGGRLYWDRTKECAPSGLKTDFRSDSVPLLSALHFRKGQGDQTQGQEESEEGYQGHIDGHQSKEGSAGEKSMGKASNLKDKVNRWAPYPPAKYNDIMSWKEAGNCLSEDFPAMTLGQVEDMKLNADLPPCVARSCRTTGRDLGGGNGSPSTPRDEQSEDREYLENQTSACPSLFREATSGTFSTSTSRSLQRHSIWDPTESKHHTSILNSPKNHDQNAQDQKLTELMGKAKAFFKDDLDPVNVSTADASMETVLFIEEKREAESVERQAEEEREEKSEKNRNPNSASPKSMEKCAHVSSLQSIQVSTSTSNIIGHSVPLTKDEEEEADGKGEDENYKEGYKAEENTRKLGDQTVHNMDEGFGSDTEATKNNQMPQRYGPEVPNLSKLGLPASLKRDLTRHIGSKHKAGIHEPNLNIARRVRSLSGIRKGEVEKDSGLKPTLRQIISSSGSRRNVNWDQVYLEVCRKRQEQGKGMPRFGIEMVAQVQYEDLPFMEGFHWKSLCKSDPVFLGGTQRKRSLSESSLVTDRSTTGVSLFTRDTHRTDLPRQCSAGPNSDLLETSRPDCMKMEEEAGRGGGKPACELGEAQEALQDHECVEAYSSYTSGAEQNDIQGNGKKRRAAGDVPSPEIPSLERKSKRRKIKCKKECSQVDQLLAVSLREDELSSSLQAVDASLIQARAVLQATYMEVQRLLLVKQQVTMEMNTLRIKRIEILQGMKEHYVDPAEPGAQETAEEPATTTLPASTLSAASVSSTHSPTHSSEAPSQTIPPHFSEHSSNTSSLPPATVLPHIKQESSSPNSLPSDSAGSILPSLHSTSLETPHNATNAGHSQSSSLRGLKGEKRPTSVDSQESGGMHSEISQDCLRDSSSKGSAQYLSGSHLQDRGALVKRCAAYSPIGNSDPGTHQAATSESQRNCSCVAAGCVEMVTESHANRTDHPVSTQPEKQLSVASLLPESKSGNRVRRLKKKKMLRKALSGEQLENSDTEQDGEPAGRPVRRIKSRKKTKGSTVSTSSSVTKEAGADEKDAERISDSCLKMVELLPAKPPKVILVDSSDPEEESIAHTLATRKSPSTLNALSPLEPTKPEAQTLACDEVSSTSELSFSSRVKTSSSKTQQCLPSVKESNVCSGVSLEGGKEEEATEGLFDGHQAAVSSMQIHSGLLYTCSGDRTVRAFNLVSRKCVAVFEGHSTKVNCLLVSSGPDLHQHLYTGSSDQTIRCYSLKTRECQEQFVLSDRVLCLHSRWKNLYAGLANGTVVSFSLKTNRKLDVFECHGPRAVSCLASAQEGARRILLVGSYDCTISVRDARSGLLLRMLEGHTKTVLCMKVVNDLVFSGSSDQSVHAYNIHTGELVRIYKGHSHAVTAVTILGKVMITACLDKLVRIYELQSHNQIQVYGGHTDMVMCMAVHKGMIYTGCYDGSVQAVRLNLIKNYRCWWHGCSMIFGVMEHLQQHLLTDHVSPNFQTLRCRWKNCDAFFSTRSNSKQDASKHMLKHTEEASPLEA